jgi:hypothetical protein
MRMPIAGVTEYLAQIKPRSVDIITVKNRTPNPIATLFINELRALAKPPGRNDSASRAAWTRCL